jgi:hypothetical protein
MHVVVRLGAVSEGPDVIVIKRHDNVVDGNSDAQALLQHRVY